MSSVKLPSGKTLYALRQACGRGRLRLDVDHVIDKLEALEKQIESLEAKLGPAVQQAVELGQADAKIKRLTSRGFVDLYNENEQLKQAIYELQMEDTHLEFISRVQDAGMHHEWDKFIDALTAAEKEDTKCG